MLFLVHVKAFGVLVMAVHFEYVRFNRMGTQHGFEKWQSRAPHPNRLGSPRRLPLKTNMLAMVHEKALGVLVMAVHFEYVRFALLPTHHRLEE